MKRGQRRYSIHYRYLLHLVVYGSQSIMFWTTISHASLPKLKGRNVCQKLEHTETYAKNKAHGFVKRAPVSGMCLLCRKVIFFSKLKQSSQNGRVDVEEQQEQFLFLMDTFLIYIFYCRNFGALITSIHFVSASFLNPGFICKGWFTNKKITSF